MELFKSLIESLNKNKKWIVIGAILYLLPVLYRLVTTNSVVPILDMTLFLRHSDSQILPVNLETLGLMFLIPGAVGAVVGTTFLEHIFNRRFVGLEKYLARIFGSMVFAFGWTAIQFFGFIFLNPVGPWGNSLWSSPDAYARNLLVALTIAPLVPYVIEFVFRFSMKK